MYTSLPNVYNAHSLHSFQPAYIKYSTPNNTPGTLSYVRDSPAIQYNICPSTLTVIPSYHADTQDARRRGEKSLNVVDIIE